MSRRICAVCHHDAWHFGTPAFPVHKSQLFPNTEYESSSLISFYRAFCIMFPKSLYMMMH
jgi:hypothetical protein